MIVVGAQQLQDLNVVILDIVMKSLKVVTVASGRPLLSEVNALAGLPSKVFGPKLKCGDLSKLDKERCVRGKIEQFDT